MHPRRAGMGGCSQVPALPRRAGCGCRPTPHSYLAGAAAGLAGWRRACRDGMLVGQCADPELVLLEGLGQGDPSTSVHQELPLSAAGGQLPPLFFQGEPWQGCRQSVCMGPVLRAQQSTSTCTLNVRTTC